MRLHYPKSTMHLRSLLRAMAFYAALLLAISSGANSSASTLYRYTLKYYAQTSLGLQPTGRVYYYWTLQGTFRPYEFWPFLADMNVSTDQYGNRMWWPYGTPLASASYAYGYQSGYYTQTISDDFTEDDVKNLINDVYASLTPSVQAALSGTLIAGTSQNSQTGAFTKFCQFNTKTVGTESNGGVVTYDPEGNIIVSYPDNTGYASGFKPLPDGTYTPVYYTIDSGGITEYQNITPSTYDTLTKDPDTGDYVLNIPNYNQQLDKIINKLDTISVNPEVNVTVPTPEITVNVSSTDVSDIEDSLVGIGQLLDSSLGTDSGQNPTITNEVPLTSDEIQAISRYRTWETGIPVLGSTLDLGLTALFGRLPVVGQEFEWMDITPSSNTRSSSNSLLSSFRIRISLDNYRNIILAFRGWIIIAEAIYFGILIWKLIREALAV